MKLHHPPAACSPAAPVPLLEIGATHHTVRAGLVGRPTEDGADFRASPPGNHSAPPLPVSERPHVQNDVKAKGCRT